MSRFNHGYEELLREQYPNHVVDQVVSTPRLAVQQENPNIKVPYVFVKSTVDPYDNGRDTLFYVPGFGEGIVNKASLAAQCAVNGMNFVQTGQNRRQILGDATDLQAENYLAVYHALGQDQKPNVFLAHSYGAQILERMVQKSPLLFEEADVVLLAPSGTIIGETYPEIAKRWLKFMKSESDQDRYMEFPDPKNVTGMASARVLAKNPIRTIKEIRALRHGVIDYPALRQNVGSLAVVSYGEDEMFPSGIDEDESTDDKISTSEKMKLNMSALVNVFGNDVRWVTPYDTGFDDFGAMIGARGATHDDEQFSPSRVLGTIQEVLTHQRNNPSKPVY